MVEVDDNFLITNVKCGGDGTIFLTDQGAMLTCGRNTRNKLGLSDAGGLFSVKKNVEKVLIPTRIKSVGCRAVDVAMGPTHTAVLTETGQVLTFGRNCEAQLGRGNCRSTAQPVLVRSMSNKIVTMIHCGATFTVAGTIENALYLWGTRTVSPSTRPTTQEGFTNTWWQDGSELGSAGIKDEKDPEFNFNEESLTGGSQGRGNDRWENNSSISDDKKSQKDINMRDVLHQPQEILALYASKEQVSKGETVSLACIHCQNQSIFLVVDTTVPLPRPGSHRQGSISKHEKKAPGKSKEQKPARKEKTKKTPEIPKQQDSNDDMDTLGPVPDWLKAELKEAVISSTDKEVRILGPKNVRKSLENKNGREPLERTSSASSRTSPKSPTVESRRIGRPPYSKSRGIRNEPTSPLVVSLKDDQLKENKKARHLKMEMEAKERKIRKEAEEVAKAKENELNYEIKRLRSELERQQSMQEVTKQKQPNTPPESAMCSLM